MLLKNDIMEDEKINRLDQVSYVPDSFTKDDIDEKVARFVKKYVKTK